MKIMDLGLFSIKTQYYKDVKKRDKKRVKKGSKMGKKQGQKSGQKRVKNGSEKKSKNRPKIGKSIKIASSGKELSEPIFWKISLLKVPAAVQDSRFLTFFGSEILRNRPELGKNRVQNR